MSKRFLGCLFIILLVFPGIIVGGEPWLADGFRYRGRIEIKTDKLDSGIDAASLALYTGGKSEVGLIIIDSKGKETPYKITGVRQGMVEIIFFVDDSDIFYAYFGNDKAEEREYTWEPVKGSLVLETRHKRERRHPADLEEMVRGFESSGVVHGKGYRRKIDDSENPFGPNDHYYSYYRGYIYCPADGDYWFSTNSDDASFLLINGSEVVSWPLGHTKDGGVNRPVVNEWTRRSKIFLSRGVHLIEYYHEEGTGSQLARAGWKKPGDKDFSVIPEESFVKTLKAEQVSLEEQGEYNSIFFNHSVIENVQFEGRQEIFATIKFSARPLFAGDNELSYLWDFGNGSRSRQKAPESVFTAGAAYNVSLTVTDNKNNSRNIAIPVSVSVPGKVKRFMLRMGVTGDSKIYGPGQHAALDFWLKNFAVHNIKAGLTTTFLDNEGRAISEHIEELSIGADSLWSRSFNASPEVCHVRFQLKYGPYLIDEKTIQFLSSSDIIPPLSLQDGDIITGQGHKTLLRLNRSVSTPKPAPRIRDAGRRFRVVIAGSYLPPSADSKSYLEEFAGMFEVHEPLEIIFLRTGSLIPQYWPLHVIADMDKILSHNPDLIVFNPEITGIGGLWDRESFNMFLSFLAFNCRSSGVPFALVVPPPLPEARARSREMAIAVKECGLAANAFLIDLYSFLAGKDSEGGFLSKEEANRGLAEYLLKCLLNISKGI